MIYSRNNRLLFVLEQALKCLRHQDGKEYKKKRLGTSLSKRLHIKNRVLINKNFLYINKILQNQIQSYYKHIRILNSIVSITISSSYRFHNQTSPIKHPCIPKHSQISIRSKNLAKPHPNAPQIPKTKITKNHHRISLLINHHVLLLFPFPRTPNGHPFTPKPDSQTSVQSQKRKARRSNTQ